MGVRSVPIPIAIGIKQSLTGNCWGFFCFCPDFRQDDRRSPEWQGLSPDPIVSGNNPALRAKYLGILLIPLWRWQGEVLDKFLPLHPLRAFAPPSPKESFGPKGDKILLHYHIPILSDDHRIHNKMTDYQQNLIISLESFLLNSLF